VIDSNRVLKFLPSVSFTPFTIQRTKIMSSNDKYNKAGTDRILAEVERTGVAASSVSDGTIFLFKRAYLVALLDKYPNEMISLFIKKEALN